MNRTARSTIRLAVPLILLSPLCAEAAADISYASAQRFVYATAGTSYQQFGSGPAYRESTSLGLFNRGAMAWASGDYYAQGEAWQRSTLTESAIRIEQSANRGGGGFPVLGTFTAYGLSLTDVTFTISDPTPYWIIMRTPDYFDGSGGLVRIANNQGDELLFSGQGTWDGILNAGTYTLHASVAALVDYQYDHFERNIPGGWLSAGIGVPTPATASLLALSGAFALRRRRA